MSYNLFFRPRNGQITSESFERYFSGRQNFKVDLPQAWYQNEETGVYFVFEITGDAPGEEGERFDVSLSVNYFRPSYFIIEAEPEVTAFVQQFDLLVSDPQIGGMGDGEYQPELLLNGWHKGNEFGCVAIIKQNGNTSDLSHLPTNALLKAWTWNYSRNDLQMRLGELTFVPQIMFLVVDGRPCTAATWPDGIPIAVPDVDYFIVPRNELAPKKFFRRVPDRTIITATAVASLFSKHGRNDNELLVLDYVEPPAEVANFVRALPLSNLDIKRIGADVMLNSELVCTAA